VSRLHQWMDDPDLYRQARAEARQQAPHRFPHLFDPGLIDRMTPTVWLDTTTEDAEPVEPVKRTRKRKPDLVKQVKRAQEAGLHVRSATVTADSVVVTFGEPDAVDGTVIETADELRRLL
jgi:hypothetical protein